MLEMNLYVIILLFSLQSSVTTTGKESEAVSSLLMDVNPSLTMEDIFELFMSSEPSQQKVFPVICTWLHLGSATKRQLLTGWGSVFIIGDDPFSPHWMSEHLEILESLSTLGLVVSIESVERMEVLQQWIDGLLSLPVIRDNPVQVL